MTLSKKQETILDFIVKFQKKNGYSPSFQEIRKPLNIGSVSTAHHHLHQLKRHGFLDWKPCMKRAITVLKTLEGVV